MFSAEEVWALVRAAASEQDGAIYLTAAFTGLRRGELIALRWRDVDFHQTRRSACGASYALGQLASPKNGKVRAVPLAPDVAAALARLADRGYMTADDDLVFVGDHGGYLDGSALRRRYVKALGRAGLRIDPPAGVLVDARPRHGQKRGDLRRRQQRPVQFHPDVTVVHATNGREGTRTPAPGRTECGPV